MKVVGLTGGIGSGKSVVADMLEELGVPVVDADELARELVEPGTEAQREIGLRWPEVVDEEGRVDRRALAERVFSDPAQRAELERMVHPRVAAESARRMAEFAREGHAVAVYEAPLILEKDLDRGMDALIVVLAPEDVRLARVLGRDRASEREVRARMAAQVGDEVRRARATWIVDNGGTLEFTRAQVRRIVEEMGERWKK